jgi:DNA polymerase-3 subunit delta
LITDMQSDVVQVMRRLAYQVTLKREALAGCGTAAAQLRRGLRSLYTLCGDEPLLIQEATDAILTRRPGSGYTERTVHTVAGAHFDCLDGCWPVGGSLSPVDKQIVEGPHFRQANLAKMGHRFATSGDQAQDNDSNLTLVVCPAWTGHAQGVQRTRQLQVTVKSTSGATGFATGGILAAVQGQRVARRDRATHLQFFFADQIRRQSADGTWEIQKLGLLYPPVNSVLNGWKVAQCGALHTAFKLL